MTSSGATSLSLPAENSQKPAGTESRGRTALFGVSPVWWVNVVLIGTAVLLFFGPVDDFSALNHPHLPWWLLAPAFLAAERCVVHLQFRRSAHTFSLGDIPLVFGLVFASASDLMIGSLVGTGIVLVSQRRLPPVKLIFNIASLALAVSVAALVVHDIVPVGDALEPGLWAATVLATQASALVTVLLIGIAISLSEGPLRVATIAQMLAMDVVVTITNTSLALAGGIILATDPRAIPLLLVPSATVFLAYRAYLLERQRHERLEFLYETTRTLSRSPEIALALEGLLAKSLEAFRAEVAEIILFGAEGNLPLRTTLGPGNTKEVMQPVDEGAARELRRLVDETAPAVRLARPFRSDKLRRYLEERHVTDAMVAMLPGEKRVIGTIMLANRLGVIRSFSEEDLKLFETLAANASVALQYDRLEQAVTQLRELQEQLQHQASHDPLTDLANRTLFVDRVTDALERDTAAVAVLFIDIDDFKTFNDSLGHPVGDELIVAVADRLRHCVRPNEIARLGGDEFAVLVADRHPVLESAIAVADRIMHAFERPVKTSEQMIYVHLSIGIASTRDSKQVDELIRDADLAMYRAKETGKGHYELFDPKIREAVLKRHGLKEEIRLAIARDELSIAYQPIIELATEEVVAAEALVRWNHPARGQLLPAEFVPFAEHTGLIIPIGQFVIAQACRQARVWEETNPGSNPLAVHANLSAIELQDAGVTLAVATAIEDAGIDPEQLVLEITESLVQDETSALAMRQLRDLGVRLALDDFGTGYSSLSYLRSLPLDILKIAKPFVEGIAQGKRQSSFMRMIVELARTLGLKVIAEGIESREELEALRELECELGQGVYIAPPLEPTGNTFPASSLSVPTTVR